MAINFFEDRSQEDLLNLIMNQQQGGLSALGPAGPRLADAAMQGRLAAPATSPNVSPAAMPPAAQGGVMPPSPHGGVSAVGQGPAWQQNMRQFISSPGFAMASAALHNLGNSAPNSVGGQMNPTAAYQQSLMANENLLMKKQEARRRDEWQAEQMRANAMRRAQMQRSMDPAADFKSLKAQGIIPETMTYAEYLQSNFASRSGASSRAFAPMVGSVDGKKVLLTPTFDPQTNTASFQQQELPEGWEEDSGLEKVDVGDEVHLFSKGDKRYLGVMPRGVPPAQKPENVAAVEQAKTEVQRVADKEERLRSNRLAYNTYQSGIKQVADAYGGTSTGTFAGLIPAITAAQKTAEGATAIMAPILKTIFRESGEGTFTEGDQKLLMDMMPTRTDPSGVIQFKLKMIDDIVRSKLEISEQSEDGSVRLK